ncbi:MAG TPA: stage II sporulation protein M [Caproicibacter sp.]|nr:stage II sporulation protein M [Caproicibacter sp.]
MGVIAIRYRNRNRRKALNSLGKDLLSAIQENQAMFLLSLILLAGMILGSIYARNAGFSALNRLDFLFAGNFKARLSQPFLMVFTASFASSFIFIFACFLCGLSMWGAFFIPIIIAFRGFGLGLTSGYLYSAYSWKGILYNLGVILPGAFVCCFAILLASLEGVRYSRMLAARSPGSVSGITLKSYILRFGAILGLACAAAIIDTLLSALLGGCFSF